MGSELFLICLKFSDLSTLVVPTQKNFGEGTICQGWEFFFNFSRRFANFEISEFCNMRHIIRKLMKSTLFCIKAICWKLFVEKLLGFTVFQKWVIESKWAICSYQSHWDPSIHISTNLKELWNLLFISNMKFWGSDFALAALFFSRRFTIFEISH